MSAPLPIDAFLPAIVAAVRARGRLVLVAPPGSGKTTRVAPALAELGPLLLLQPRRVAARAIARRIAEEQGLELGEQVGWQVRFERRFSRRTRLLVATEGVLTARLARDPLLEGFRVVVLDEFHERSLHADLAIALAREAARARSDLALVVMSATLDAGPVAAYLDGAEVIELPGRPHPVATSYAPELSMAGAVRAALDRPGGHVLAFLPGAGEIRRVESELGALAGAQVLPLHGSLDAEAQDRALAPGAGRKVILATNVAETSLTVDGVTEVVDGGEVKVARYDAARGIDRLDLERVSADSAEQRAGRAGRTGPGRALRLWDPRLTLRPRREPEIERVDLASPLLDILAWGGDPMSFPWFEAPPPERLSAAMALLERLGAVAGGRLTALGQSLNAFPLHPRLARLVIAGGGSRRSAAAAAILSEPDFFRDNPVATASDLLPRLDRLSAAPPGLRRAAEQIAAIARQQAGPDDDAADDEPALLRAVLAAYPDRVAARREPRSPRLLLASGHGAVLGRESGVGEGDWLVALDVVAAERAGTSEARVRMASRIEKDWLRATTIEVEHRFDPASGSVRAVAVERYDALQLRERPVAPDPERSQELLVSVLLRQGLGEASELLQRRLRFAGIELDLEAILRAAARGRTSLPRVELTGQLSRSQLGELERFAPESLEVPSGRRIRLDYREDGRVVLAVKLQELFGLAASPRVGRKGEPVTLELLSPAGRPVQTTRDLASFWKVGYPEVRRELRGRYPRHPWPEDPETAMATARAKRTR